jgi:hypothetical protein
MGNTSARSSRGIPVIQRRKGCQLRPLSECHLDLTATNARVSIEYVYDSQDRSNWFLARRHPAS